MTPDCFQILEQPQRPWLDPEELKEKFHRLSAVHHPDAAPAPDGVDFAEINAAYQTLREPRSRSRCLLELEYPAGLAPGRPLPPSLMELFSETGKVQQALNEFLAKQSRASGPLAQALLASEKYALIDSIEARRAVLQERWNALEAELRQLDRAWDEPGDELKEQLASLHQQFAFIGKWSDRLQEALVKLSI